MISIYSVPSMILQGSPANSITNLWPTILFLLALVVALFIVLRVRRIRNMVNAYRVGSIEGLGVLGVIAGGVIGFLLRPSVPLIGQLPLEHIITRGSELKGMDRMLVSTAETSFNYLLVGIIIGGIIGAGLGYILYKRKTELKGSASAVTDIKGSDDIPGHINKLAELRDKGVLTEEEFQTKKNELLNRL